MAKATAAAGKENKKKGASKSVKGKSAKPLKSHNRPKRLRNWDNESMLRAIEAVQKGEMGVNRAALECGVPRTTLKDRLSGRVQHGTKPGPVSYLTQEEEKELVDFLVNCSSMGFGKTRGEVFQIVKAICERKGVKEAGHISDGWWYRFRQRWPKLSLRKGDPFPQARVLMTTRTVFESYFELLQATLEQHDLFNSPAQLYNCDESGMPLERKTPKTIAIRGTKKVRQRSSGNKTQVSVLGCVSATGQAIPPMVIFAGNNFNHHLSAGEVPGTLYGMSENGWMDQELLTGSPHTS